MPAKSRAQQRFMRIVKSVKDGDKPRSEVSDTVKKAADSLSNKEIEDYLSTNPKNLPDRVDNEELTLEDKVRKYVKEYVKKIVDEYGLSGTVSNNHIANPSAVYKSDGTLINKDTPNGEIEQEKSDIDESFYKLKDEVELGDGKKGTYYLSSVGYDSNGNWSYMVSRGSNPTKKIQHQSGLFGDKITKDSIKNGEIDEKTANGLIKYYEKYIGEQTVQEAIGTLKKLSDFAKKYNISPSAGNKYKLEDFEVVLRAPIDNDDLYDLAKYFADTIVSRSVGMGWDDLPDINSLWDVIESGHTDMKSFVADIKDLAKERFEDTMGGSGDLLDHKNGKGKLFTEKELKKEKCKRTEGSSPFSQNEPIKKEIAVVLNPEDQPKTGTSTDLKGVNSDTDIDPMDIQGGPIDSGEQEPPEEMEDTPELDDPTPYKGMGDTEPMHDKDIVEPHDDMMSSLVDLPNFEKTMIIRNPESLKKLLKYFRDKRVVECKYNDNTIELNKLKKRGNNLEVYVGEENNIRKLKFEIKLNECKNSKIYNELLFGKK